MARQQDTQIPFPLSATQRTLPIALLRAREAVMERFRPMLRGIDITEQQWRVLRVVQEADEIDATQLARTACVLAPSLTRILKTLEARGLIAATRDPADRRRTLVRMTEPGAALLHDAAQDSARIYAEIEARLGADRIAALLDELEALTADLTAPAVYASAARADEARTASSICSCARVGIQSLR